MKSLRLIFFAAVISADPSFCGPLIFFDYANHTSQMIGILYQAVGKLLGDSLGLGFANLVFGNQCCQERAVHPPGHVWDDYSVCEVLCTTFQSRTR